MVMDDDDELLEDPELGPPDPPPGPVGLTYYQLAFPAIKGRAWTGSWVQDVPAHVRTLMVPFPSIGAIPEERAFGIGLRGWDAGTIYVEALRG